MSVGGRVAVALLAVGLYCSATASAQGTAFQSGDVFLSIGRGAVNAYRLDPATGAYSQVSVLSTGDFAFRTTGSAFDNDGNFYVTMFNNNAVSGPVYRFPRDFDLFTQVATSIPTFGNSPESIVFDAVGNMYIGHKYRGAPVVPCVPPPPGVIRRGDVITKVALDGTCVAAYDVEREGLRRPLVPPVLPGDPSDPEGDFNDPQGADWIDLANDQRTLFYTSAGRRIMRFDTLTNTQLPDFANLSLMDIDEGQLFALRILANRSVLVADNVNIKLLNDNGVVIQTYDIAEDPSLGIPAHDNWFSLNLDPDGLSFWSGDGRTRQIHKFDIASGALLATIDTGADGAEFLFGVSVFKELTQGSVQPTRCEAMSLVMSTVNGSTCGTLTLSGTLMCAGQPVAGKSISFSLNGTLAGQATTNSSGVASLSGVTSPTQPGTVQNGAAASFVGDPDYAAASGTADVVLSDEGCVHPPTQCQPTLVVTPANASTCGTLTLSAMLTCAGGPLAGKTINFALNGAAVGTGVTDQDGMATLMSLSPPAQTGTFIGAVSASFVEDAGALAAVGVGDLTLSAEGCELHPKDCREPGHGHPTGTKPSRPVHHPGDRDCRNRSHHHPAHDDCKPVRHAVRKTAQRSTTK